MSGANIKGGVGWLPYSVTAAVIVFVLAPLLVIVSISLSAAPFASFPPRGFTLDWYTQVLSDPDFLESAAFSLALALASSIASVALGLPAALALSRVPLSVAWLMRTLLMSPLIFPALITGLALLRFFSTTDMRSAAINLFCGHVLITIPYVMRTTLASLEMVDHSLAEAAQTLGADRWRTFRLITLPQIAPGIGAGTLFAFMVSLDNYPISMWLADARALPLPVLLVNNMQRVFDPSVSAMASLMILAGVIAVLILEKLVGLRRAVGF